MEINCVSILGLRMSRTSSCADKYKQNECSQNALNGIVSLDKKSGKSISFGNKPCVLNPTNFGISKYGEITADEGIQLFSMLRYGKYLDIGDDRFDFSNCNRIREENLAFLDRIKYSSDKAKFIEHYKKLTGFPDLNAVSQRIKREFISAVESASTYGLFSKQRVEVAGYDGVCSVGRGKALPGSDLDKAYVILRGSGDEAEDIEIVNQFKGRLWDNTDQRVLSYNHDNAAFPQVYTKAQIEKLTEAVDVKDRPYRRPQYYGEWVSEVYKKQYELLFDQWDQPIAEYMDDYVKANPYWVHYCRQFPKMGDDVVRVNNPSRENIKNVGFVLESLREGKVLSGNKKNLDWKFLSSFSYEVVNLSQLAALKNISDQKPKRLARNNLMLEFSQWDLDKQFRFIKTMIKSACANNREFTYEFSKYFSKPGQDMFAPLIKALMG